MGGIVSILGNAVGSVVENFFPNPEDKLKRLELESQIRKAIIEQEGAIQKAQIEVNAQEAKSSNVFISGWRPFVGWVGAISLAYVSIIEPVLRFVAKVFFDYSGVFPVIDTTITMQVLLGILGLGTLRTREKEKGVSSKH